MDSENKQKVNFRGTPSDFAEFVMESWDELQKVINDPSLSLYVEPDIKQGQQSRIVTITFQTERKIGRESQAGGKGIMNYYAKQAHQAVPYCDYGQISAKISPDNMAVLEVVGFQVEQNSAWSNLWRWLYEKLAADGYVVTQSATVEHARDIQNHLTGSMPTKGRSTKVLAIVLFVLGVAIAFVTNVASSTVPEEWRPYLWLSIPLLVVLVIISIVLLARQ